MTRLRMTRERPLHPALTPPVTLLQWNPLLSAGRGFAPSRGPAPLLLLCYCSSFWEAVMKTAQWTAVIVLALMVGGLTFVMVYLGGSNPPITTDPSELPSLTFANKKFPL